MGESLSPWNPSCNRSIRVELSGDTTTSDAGALLLREALDRSGVIEALEGNLIDQRDPLRIRHSLASQQQDSNLRPSASEAGFAS